MTNVVHKDRPHDVYIGRPSKWGNPFPLEHESQRAYVILKYELWLSTQPDLLRALPELKDKTLGCFCSPLACHGDVLVRFANDKYIPHWFSNMIPMGEPYMYQGVAYSTSENFYQAMKLPKDKVELRRQIAGFNPYKAKRDIVKYPLREDWIPEESVRVMKHILSYKFSLPMWKSLLHLTEDWELVEWNMWGDKFWGKDLATGEGENTLGKILMDIRNV